MKMLGLEKFLKFHIGRHLACDLEFTIHDQSWRDHHSEVGKAQEVGDFLKFIIKAEAIGGSGRGGCELIALGTTGAENLEFHVDDLLLVVVLISGKISKSPSAERGERDGE